jgi:hypothetical protein
MAMTIDQIIESAKQQAARAQGNSDVIVAKLGLISPRAGLLHAEVRGEGLTLDMSEALQQGRKIFEKFLPYVKKAVCTDFGYCKRRDVVDKALDEFLGPIVKAIMKRIPVSGKVPDWLARLLKLFGIAAGSLDVVVTLFVAWLIVQGCNALCHCRAR